MPRPTTVCVAGWFSCLVVLAPVAAPARTPPPKRILVRPDGGLSPVREGFSPAFTGTIDLALALRPDTESVLVIDGILRNTRDPQTEGEREVRTSSRRVGLVYLRDLPLRDVVARVAAAPEHSVVLFIEQAMRTPTQGLSARDALREISGASRVPTFSLVPEYVGLGSVGGYVQDFAADARRTPPLVVRMPGAVVRDVPADRNTYQTLLDWRQLQRWRI